MWRTLFAILILFNLAYGESGERRDYIVDKFTGINVVTDSINLAPGEGLEMSNFVLDKFGALHKRYGVINWNDSLISGGHIKDTRYVDDKNGVEYLYIASDSFVFQADGRAQFNDSANWIEGHRELSYSPDSIFFDTTDATGHAKGIYSRLDSVDFISVVAPGDRIDIGDTTRFIVDSIMADTMLIVTDSVYAYHEDTVGYRLLKYIKGDVQLSSWNGNLYVADSKNEPWQYNSKNENIRMLGLIDSGYVDSTFIIDTSAVAYHPDTIQSWPGNDVFSCWHTDGLTDSFHVGDFLHIIVQFWGHVGLQYVWSSEIQAIDAIDYYIYTAEPLTEELFYPPGMEQMLTFPQEMFIPYISGGLWTVTCVVLPLNYGPINENEYGFVDTSKYWAPDEFQAMYIMNGNNARRYSMITRNETESIYYDTTVTFTAGDRYYLFWQLPAAKGIKIYKGFYPLYGHLWKDSLFISTYYWDQIIFHRNRLYAIGKEIISDSTDYADPGDTVNTNRVWFAELGRPNHVPADYNFDIEGASKRTRTVISDDDNVAFFELRDDLYVITKSNIFRISGEPTYGPEDLYISQVIQGVGTNQPRGVITTKNKMAYIMNQEGIWLFDGRTIEKISYKIDPLIERYRASSMVAGQFKDNLLFSYSDSNVTIVLHEPTKGFTTWNLGMECINNQFVSIDSNYFLFSRFEDSASVLKYPRDYATFTDVYSSADTNIMVPISYKSGWQTLGPTLYNRMLEWMVVTMTKGIGDAYLSLYVDFTDTVSVDTISTTGHQIIRLKPPATARGNFFQWEISNAALITDVTISGVYIRCYDGEIR